MQARSRNLDRTICSRSKSSKTAVSTLLDANTYAGRDQFHDKGGTEEFEAGGKLTASAIMIHTKPPALFPVPLFPGLTGRAFRALLRLMVGEFTNTVTDKLGWGRKKETFSISGVLDFARMPTLMRASAFSKRK